MHPKFNRSDVVSALDEASGLIDVIGGNASSKKEKRLRAWRKVAASFSWNRIADLHRATDPRVKVSGDEMNILRAAAKAESGEEREARKQYRELVQRIARLESRLLTIDPEFHSEDVAGLRAGLHERGGMDSALD